MMSLEKQKIELVRGREDDFENFEKIGRGGFASVYKCIHKIDKKPYALKKIKIESENDQHKLEKVSKIYSEVKQLSSLEHENIVRYFGCWMSCAKEREGMISNQISPCPKQLKKKMKTLSSATFSEEMNEGRRGHGDDSEKFIVLDWSDDDFIHFEGEEKNGAQRPVELPEIVINSPQVELAGFDQHEGRMKKRINKLDVIHMNLVSSSSSNNFRSSGMDTNSSVGEENSFTLTNEKESPNLLGRRRVGGRENPEVMLKTLTNSFRKPVNKKGSGSKEKNIEFFIQMELCDQTLKEYLQNRNSQSRGRELNTEETLTAFKFAKQLVRALDYLMSQGVLHRDIKPSNIFVNNAKQLKIGDFGLVKECKFLPVMDPSPLMSTLKVPGDYMKNVSYCFDEQDHEENQEEYTIATEEEIDIETEDREARKIKTDSKKKNQSSKRRRKNQHRLNQENGSDPASPTKNTKKHKYHELINQPMVSCEIDFNDLPMFRRIRKYTSDNCNFKAPAQPIKEVVRKGVRFKEDNYRFGGDPETCNNINDNSPYSPPSDNQGDQPGFFNQAEQAAMQLSECRFNQVLRQRSKSMFIQQEEFTSNIGTKLYASPEQTGSKYYSFETDHFSAALVLLELFHPLYTEMQRIHILTQARESILPVQFQLKYKDLHQALKSLLNPDPWKRPDLSQISVLISQEELNFRKGTKYTQRFMFRKEEDLDGWKPRYLLIKESVLFVYKSAEDQKAECVFDLNKYDVSLNDGELKLCNQFVNGCLVKPMENLNSTGGSNQSISKNTRIQEKLLFNLRNDKTKQLAKEGSDYSTPTTGLEEQCDECLVTKQGMDSKIKEFFDMVVLEKHSSSSFFSK